MIVILIIYRDYQKIWDAQEPLIKMHTNYQKCCPKGFMGKNKSPYCMQLEMNFNSLSKYKKVITGYYGDETDVSKIKQIMNGPENDNNINKSVDNNYKKSWYKFWGGKKTKKYNQEKKFIQIKISIVK